MTNKSINIQTVQINTSGDLNATIGLLLREIGIPANLKGYRAAKEAIRAAVIEPSLIDAITKELYPHVAKYLGTTASRVERCIRHAIDVAWDRGDRDLFQSIFGNTISNSKGKPTNSEFIALIAEHLLEQYEAVTEFEPLVDFDDEDDTQEDR